MSEYTKLELTEEALQRIIDHCKVAEDKADDVQDALELKMDKSNPSGTGSFSMNRKSGSTVGSNSHTEGTENIASGGASHAEGAANTASGNYSHAEGETSLARGIGSHAEGKQTIASGDYSHTGGRYTRANYSYQTAIGSYNNNKSNTIFEVGNGSAENNRNNALEVRQNGDVYIDGDFYNGDGEKVEPFGKAFFVSFTGTSNGNNYSYSCDKTYSQIREQFDAKNLIVAHFYDELDSIEMTTSLVGVDAGEDELNFRFFVSEDGLGTIYWDISIDSTDTITSSGFKRSKEIPYVSSSDEGKVLSVNSNGDYYVKEVDNTPTMSSNNLISSGAVWNKLQGSKIASNRGGTITISDYGMTEGITMYFNPSQDLHGYSKPWAGGAGKNLYVGSPSFDGYTNISSWTLQDEKYNGHDVYKKSSEWGGTSNHFSVEEGIYTFSVMVKTGINTNAFIYIIDHSDVGKATVDVTSKQVSTSTSWTKVQCTFTVTSAGLIAPRIELGSNNDIYISEYQLEQGSTATSYEPYSNICPIVGQDNATFSWGSDNELVMNFGNIYYGGVCDFVGYMYSDWDYIASYNGETLPGEWMSDRDKYASGTTPTTGAEVVYKTTATHVKVTPPTNLNLTHAYPIEYNGSMVTIIYQPRGTVLEEAKKYTNRKIGQLVPQDYSTSEKKVGTWIDGTTVYQKTIDLGALPNATSKVISTNIVASDIIKYDIFASATISGQYKKQILTIPNGYVGGDDVTSVAHIDSHDKIVLSITTGSDRTAFNGYATVQYTKPND